MLEFFYQAIEEASNGELLAFLGSVIGGSLGFLGAIIGVLIGMFIESSKERREEKSHKKKMLIALFYEIWLNGSMLASISSKNLSGLQRISFKCSSWDIYKEEFMFEYSKTKNESKDSQRIFIYYDFIKQNLTRKKYEYKDIEFLIETQIRAIDIIKNRYNLKNKKWYKKNDEFIRVKEILDSLEELQKELMNPMRGEST